MSFEPSRSAKYLPFGDSALVVEFGDRVDPDINRRVVALSKAILDAEIGGVEELVPTYRSLLIRYNSLKMTYEQLVFRVRNVQETIEIAVAEKKGRTVTVPVVYGGEYGPDLTYVATYHRLSEQQVVQLHSAREYWVYMIGFVAGFPYLGEVADEIATPRLETPRTKVPAGSVGIAEKQTGIYPNEAPGGWQIIGKTPLRLFDPQQQPPALLETGDTVKFKPISEKELKAAKKDPEDLRNLVAKEQPQ